MRYTSPPPDGYKRPESILVVIYTLDRLVLLLERTAPLGFWQSVTGSLRWGESPRAAAEREVWEESGLYAGGRLLTSGQCYHFPIVPPWQARYHPTARENCEHLFYLPLPQRRLVRLNQREHRRYRWLPCPAAARRVSSWSNRDALERLAPPIGQRE